LPITVKVKDLMDTKVFSIEEGKTVREAIQKMVEANVWSLLVDRRGLPLGVVTERDVLRRCISKGLNPEKTRIEEIMSSPLVTAYPDEAVGEAMKRMVEKNIRRLYVIDNGRIVGRVTQTALFESMLGIMMTLSSMPYQL